MEAAITTTRKASAHAHVSGHSEREKAERALSDAQSRTAAAKTAVEELSGKLASEEAFRAQVREHYDAACVQERTGDARTFQAETAGSDIRLRGLELRLARAQSDFQGCREVEVRLCEQLTQLQFQEAVAAERVECDRMIKTASDASDGIVRAAEAFEAALVALKTKPWLDGRHRNLAANAAFKLVARNRGFNY